MNRVIITEHALQRLKQRFGMDCSADSLAAMLWSYPIVRMGVEMAEAKPVESEFTEWRAKIRHANMQAVFKRNTVVTLYPIGGQK